MVPLSFWKFEVLFFHANPYTNLPIIFYHPSVQRFMDVCMIFLPHFNLSWMSWLSDNERQNSISKSGGYAGIWTWVSIVHSPNHYTRLASSSPSYYLLTTVLLFQTFQCFHKQGSQAKINNHNNQRDQDRRVETQRETALVVMQIKCKASHSDS